MQNQLARGWAPALLVAGLLRPLASPAQTPLGQPSLDESKVQIWCATARYVYADAGRPQLQRTLRCEGGNLQALAASLRPDSLRIYSVLYAPIEGKGKIYKGLKDNPARLAALTKAIINKLKSSPARQRDPARLAGLQALEKKLTDYVQTGLPPADPAPAPEADAEASANAGLAEAAEASGTPAAAMRPGAPVAAEPLLNRIFAPLALILSILSLVLYGMLRLSLGRTLRELRRASPPAGRDFTAAQRQQLDDLVAQRVAEALRTARPTLPADADAQLPG
ncbi:hypothetical protein GCM10023172_24320 [Hymenobacter ginsengisoli]|uniref:Uncharacterized protein n=1 Tax=Hymenobacter ginsengisoli TaxID=1051626 RepID=A0ABP8QFW3_9BACT|nr:MULTISPECIES: hypothetical protein [unclassified Hymenobacter]MBO2033175.1 hypothetical protein [Hymenobacter sp. BT559]